MGNGDREEQSIRQAMLPQRHANLKQTRQIEYEYTNIDDHDTQQRDIEKKSLKNKNYCEK